MGKIEYSVEKIKKALANDFNIPTALSEFFSLIRNYNRDFAKNPADEKTLKAYQMVSDFMKDSTGLVHSDYDSILKEVQKAKIALKSNGKESLNEEEIQKLLNERKLARESKDWKRSDEIRDILTKAGVEIKDS